jgi:hypothetical protein
MEKWVLRIARNERIWVRWVRVGKGVPKELHPIPWASEPTVGAWKWPDKENFTNMDSDKLRRLEFVSTKLQSTDFFTILCSADVFRLGKSQIESI